MKTEKLFISHNNKIYGNNSHIQVFDNKEIIIEYCKGIITYDENFIKLKLKNLYLIISGIDMNLCNYSTQGVIIKGKINSVSFEEV